MKIMRIPLGILILFSIACAKSPSNNIVLIGVDTLRRDHVGFYNPANKALTPHIDALLEESVVFDNAFSVVPFTLPSFASAMTGLYPIHHGVHLNHGFALSDRFTTIPEIFRQKGYATLGVVSGVPLQKGKGLEQGFQTYNDIFLERPATGNPLFKAASAIQANQDRSQRPGMDVSFIAMDLLSTLRSSPFLLFVHYFDPHFPYEPPREYAERAIDSTYAGEVAYTDAAVGALIDHLKQKELYDDALIIFFADHGEGLGEHGEAQHGYYLFNSTVAVPLAVKPPSRLGRRWPKGRRAPVATLMDIMPTLCAWARLKAPAELDGKSLVPVLEGKPGGGESDIFLESEYPYLSYGWEKMHGLIRMPYKAVFSSEPQVFEFIKDPGESSNLYPKDYDQLFAAARPMLGASQAGRNGGPSSPEEIRNLMSLGYMAPSSGRSDAPQIPPSRWPEAAKVFDDGYAAIAAGDQSAALKLFSGKLIEHPQDYRLRLMRGFVFSLMGKIQEAEADLTAALSLNPDAVEGYELLLQLYQRTAQWDKHAGIVGRLKGRYPPGTFLQFVTADYLHAGNIDGALDWLKKVSDSQPDASYPMIKTVEILQGTGRAEAAERFVGRIIADEAKHPLVASFFRGMKLLNGKQLPEALGVLKQCCESGADFPQPYLYCGLIYKSLKDPQSALLYLNAARVLAADDPQISYEWADALALNGKLAEANAGFERLLIMEPQNPKVHLAVMKSAWVLKNMDRAQTAYQWLVGHAPDFLRAAQQQDPLVKQITQ